MDKFECSRVKSIFRAYFSHNSFCDLYSLLCLNRPWISFYSIGNNCVPYCQGCTPFTCLLPTPALPNMLVLDSNYRHTCGHTRQWPFFFLPILHHSTCGSRLFLSLVGPHTASLRLPHAGACTHRRRTCACHRNHKSTGVFLLQAHTLSTQGQCPAPHQWMLGSCPLPVDARVLPVDARVLPFTCGC